ncbi:hypothetical protein BDR07DRAFT_1374390 [Suillus spraguei]|nr:hypothetical protein BDR07DRAFT_1374390 [Suillus spraguei]
MSQAPDVPAMRSMNAQTFCHSKCKTFNINLIPCPHPGCSCTFKNRSGLTQHRHAIHDFSFEIQREAPLNEMQEEAPLYDGDVEMDYQPTSGGTHHDYHLQLDSHICDEAGDFIHPDLLPPPYTSRAPDNDNWMPYRNQLKFETAKFLYSKVRMSGGNIDKLMHLWSGTLAKHNDTPPFADHRDLYSTIDNTPVGDVPWKCFSMKYNTNNHDTRNVESAPWMEKMYTTWFRNPHTIIQNMLANPDFKDEMDYVPYREFNGEGNWAWDQVDEIAKDPSLMVQPSSQ